MSTLIYIKTIYTFAAYRLMKIQFYIPTISVKKNKKYYFRYSRRQYKVEVDHTPVCSHLILGEPSVTV